MCWAHLDYANSKQNYNSCHPISRRFDLWLQHWKYVVHSCAYPLPINWWYMYVYIKYKNPAFVFMQILNDYATLTSLLFTKWKFEFPSETIVYFMLSSQHRIFTLKHNVRVNRTYTRTRHHVLTHNLLIAYLNTKLQVDNGMVCALGVGWSSQ